MPTYRFDPPSDLTEAQLTELFRELFSDVSEAQFLDMDPEFAEFFVENVVDERTVVYRPTYELLGPFSTATDLADSLGDITVTVTTDGDQYVFITCDIALFTFDMGCSCVISIQEGTTVLQSVPSNTAPYGYWFFPGSRTSVQLIPTAGSHTYKITLTPTDGAVYVLTSATAPSFIRATVGT